MLNKNSTSERTTSADIHQRKAKNEGPTILQTAESRPRQEVSEQTVTMEINDNELSECATDSAKIRAMQGRSMEPEPISKKWPQKEDLRLDLPSDINDDITEDIQIKRYQYDGKYNNKTDPNACKNGYTNSAFVDNEPRESIVHKRLEKRESNTDGMSV